MPNSEVPLVVENPRRKKLSLYPEVDLSPLRNRPTQYRWFARKPHFVPKNRKMFVTQEPKPPATKNLKAVVAVPRYAITKGSFSVWSEPKKPVPKEIYVIVIQVRLPSELQNNKEYPAKDFTGTIIGAEPLSKQSIRYRSKRQP